MNNKIDTAGEQLENAFEQFNQFSEKLADSYGELESHVTRLTRELAKARNERLVHLAEKELLANRLESLLDTLPGGVVVLDSDDCITQTNPVARSMLALISEENNHQSSLQGEKWQSIAQKSIISDGDELRLIDGRWVNISSCPVADDAENINSGKIILISDISETRTLQNKLNRQQRLSSLGEMVASLAHQIRTPLSSAILYISTLNHPSNGEKERITFADKAKERLYHLERLVNDMLIFARGDVTASEYINCHCFMRKIQSLVETVEPCRNVDVFIDNALHQVTIQANNDALLSAIQNVINNAVEACHQDSSANEVKIEISGMLTGNNSFEINIKDNGVGMSDTTKERMLEPFYTTKIHGTGLGMAVVNATINQYGGDLQVKSEEGKGSNFKIKFPCAKAAGLLPSDLASKRIESVKNNLYSAFHQQNMLEMSGKREVTL